MTVSTPAALRGTVASLAAPSVSSENTSPPWMSGASRGAGDREHFQTGVERVERVLIGVRTDRGLGRQQSHPALAGGLHRRAGSRHDHADDRSGKGRLQLGQGRRGRRVTRDDDELDPQADQPGRGGKGETAHLRQGLGSVGEVPGVAQVDEIFVRAG